jgi:hypothetical protein
MASFVCCDNRQIQEKITFWTMDFHDTKRFLSLTKVESPVLTQSVVS